MRSRYKKFKEAEFFNELTQSLRVYLLFCKYYREVFLLLQFSIQKIQRGRIFLMNRHSHFEFICFFANIIEKGLCCWSSRYKKFKEAEFFNELTRSFRVYLLFCKYYREVVLLLRFSIQKFKEAEFFTRTDRFCVLSLRVYFF